MQGTIVSCHACLIDLLADCRAQWEASEVTEESIGACLQPAEDRYWAAEQALTRLAPTAQTQEALLHFMLEESALQMQMLHGVPVPSDLPWEQCTRSSSSSGMRA